MIIQIYEIGTPEEARLVAEAGIDHIGVLVGYGKFPKEKSIEQAREIFSAIPAPVKKVALYLWGDREQMKDIAQNLRPDILHLCALPETLTPDDVKKLKHDFPFVKIMRSIPVVGEESVGLAKSYDGIADYLLLDSHKKDDIQVGATGFTHDWNISKKIVDSVKIPVILAGGLGADNVAEAIRQVHPYGVDSKTKTDKQDGSSTKDIEEVKKFVQAVREIPG